ncbi:MAG TPA: SCO family protein [Acidimicrobiales bacterium]|nr:SCO family protein [Acidimicrobiales bacterium]
MPGMRSGLNANNSTIVHAFKIALLHQGLVAAVILAVLMMVWLGIRAFESTRAGGGDVGTGGPAASFLAGTRGLIAEAPARRFVRVSFAVLWIFDGLLQAQPDMPLGMTADVIKPVAATSPAWVQHVANFGATIWSFHPIEAPASAVWIQVGIGIWLLVAPRGTWSRLAGTAAVGWGIAVWVFGEAFGGIFAPGASWLFGTPGAVIFYVAAGALVALPERWWDSPRLGRGVLGVFGLYLAGMAVLQAWPGRGSWQGSLSDGSPGTLATMAFTMGRTPQPHVTSSWATSFANFDMAHGFAVDLVVVLALALLGAVFIAARPRPLPYAVAVYGVLALADWVLVQDFGFFGGVGTDPNSMIPSILFVMTGFLAVARVPNRSEANAPVATLAPRLSAHERFGAWREAVKRRPSVVLPSVTALGAVGIVLLGAAPMAVASANTHADPILIEATSGTANLTNYLPKRDFHLVDQFGRPVSLASLRGKTVALTFLDPVCTSTCPIIGHEFRQADAMLSTLGSKVELVAVDANPLYRERVYGMQFAKQEGFDTVHNMLFLTGSLSQLSRAWTTFGIQVQYEPGGAMIGHSEVAYVLDPQGHVRYVTTDDPGQGTAAQQSSFATALSGLVRSVASR